MVDIDTIGAGGGSIAYVDAGGVFRVGPQSAGADPGPACYGRGGDGADVDRRPARARAPAAGPRPARRRHGARPRARGGGRAQGRGAARRRRRGGGARRAPDPEVRDDAGDRAELGAPRLRPARLHARRRRRRRPAVRLRHRARARDPARARAAAPRHHRRDRPARDRPPARVRRHRAPRAEDLDRARLAGRFDELVAQAVAQLDADGVPEDRRLVRRLADCRYAGQGYEVRFDVPAGAIDDAWVEALRGRSTRRTSGSTATASTPRSRSSTSAPSASAASTSSSRPSSSTVTATPHERRRSSARSSSRSTARPSGT